MKKRSQSVWIKIKNKVFYVWIYWISQLIFSLNIQSTMKIFFSLFHWSLIVGKSWCLLWEWSSLATIITGAPSTSFTESGTSAFPGLGALLGTLPVVGLRDGAVLVVWVGSSVFGIVTLPEGLGVVEVFSVLWYPSGGESDLWGWASRDGGEESSKSEEFHRKYVFYYKYNYKNYFNFL